MIWYYIVLYYIISFALKILFVIADNNFYIQVRMWRWLSLSGGGWY